MNMQVQTIDLSSVNAGEKFVNSLHETGFAVLRNHPVSQDLLENLYHDWLAFFSSEQKQDYLYDPENRDGSQQGYHPPHVSETAVGHTVRDLKEYYHFRPYGNNPPALAAMLNQYRSLALALGDQLLEWIQEFTPEGTFSDLGTDLPDIISSDASLLRVLHYPPLTGDEQAGAVRAAAHEDINLITILPVAEQPGLQVQDNDDNWIDVASIAGEIVVNSGDMLRELTSGYYPSTSHRVLNPGGDIANVSRISIPFFLTPRLDLRLSDQYTAGSYLDERLALITGKA